MLFNFGFNLKTWILTSDLVPYGLSHVLLLWCLLIHIVCILYVLLNPIEDRCANPRCQVMQATKFCTAVPNICGSWVWNLIHVILMVPRVLRWFLDFWKICERDIIFPIANQKDRKVFEKTVTGYWAHKWVCEETTWWWASVLVFLIVIVEWLNQGFWYCPVMYPKWQGNFLVNIIGTDHWEN